MLPEFHRFHSVYVEITKTIHDHGGPGWEFGTCLWSPTTNSSGADRYRIMREPRQGDLVLHFLEIAWPDRGEETCLIGTSLVQAPYKQIQDQPPLAGPWSGRTAYFRIDLRSYEPLSPPLPLHTLLDIYGQEIRNEIIESSPRFYPFSRFGDGLRTVQGIYLARCTENLYRILSHALGIEADTSNHEKLDSQKHLDYAEAQRLAAERYFFARNPQLRKDAIANYGTTCQICSFNFAHVYGDRGEGYIEVHHSNPLSERSEKEWTTLLKTQIKDVSVLCANCHRMIHRSRPAWSLDQLRRSINP